VDCFVSRGASFRDGWRFKVSPYERFVRLLMQVAARRLAKEIMSKFITLYSRSRSCLGGDVFLKGTFHLHVFNNT